MRLRYLLITLLIIFSNCKREENWNTEAFFEQAFKLISDYSIKKNEINWIDLKRIVKDSIKSFETNDDVYKAIDFTIKLINDGHSVFVAPQHPDSTISNRLLIDSLKVPEIKTMIIQNNIGYIKLPGFIANDGLTKDYAYEIRKALLKIDKTGGLSGWIIDLRGNSGGKLGIEPLGLMPLFNQPLIGMSCDNQGNYKELKCYNGYFSFDGIIIDSLIYESTIINKNKNIAVLINEKTVSGGEFLTLAFRFQENTRTFGSKTKGKTSHLRLIEFKSNAKLLLATDYYCDKDSVLIKRGITPEIECTEAESLSEAIEWINYAI